VVEGVDMRLEEGFLALRGKGHGEGAARVTQAHDKQLDRDRFSSKDDFGFTPIDLSILTRVKLKGQEDRRSLMGATVLTNVGADMRLAAEVAGGLDESEHAVRGIALLMGQALVLGQEGVQLGFEGAKDGSGARRGSDIGGSFCGLKGFPNGLAGNVLLAGDLANGLVLDIVGMSNGGAVFHWYHLHLW
jgi:hypothetical protein